MQFRETSLSGAWLVEPEPVADERGFFERTFCISEFRGRGLESGFVQHSVSSSVRRGTLRGMHFQRRPHTEVKVVTCLKGAIWDVIIDLRSDSPTFRQWQGFELSEDNRQQLYIPEGFAHGMQTLRNGTRVGYLISAPFAASAADGVRYDDPAFLIDWPLPVTSISAKDQNWQTFSVASLTERGMDRQFARN